MAKFRLKMDLSQFYEDERNMAYILVDPKWDQVICLQDHVEKLFDVSEVHFVTDDGIYIPPRESIDIIKSNDVLRAIIPQKLKKKKKKSKSSSFVEEQNPEDSLNLNGDKRKCNGELLTCSTPNENPKKKQKTSINETVDLSVPTHFNLKALQNGFTTSSNIVTSTNNSNGLEKSESNEISMQETQHDEDTLKTRKRKRIRKKKENGDETFKTETSSRLSSVPVPISSSTLRLSKSMSTPTKSPKHVHFDKDDTMTENNLNSTKQRVIYRCQLNLDDLKPREIQAEHEENTSISNKPKILIQENIVIVRASDVSNEHNDSSVIEVEDSIEKSEPEPSNTIIEKNQDISIEKLLPLSEELLELPNVGDIILFKIYRLDDSGSPEISEYICGRCEEVNSTEKTVNCLVLDGIHEIKRDTSRQSINYAGDLKPTNKPNCFFLVLDELLDKRVFRMS